MTVGYTTRRLDLFSLAGHNGRLSVDYLELFTFLHKTRPEKRVWRNGRRAVMVPRLRRTGNYFVFAACEGDVGVAPRIMNMLTAEERFAEIDAAADAVIHLTHGVINPETRVAAIEYVHRGAKARDVTQALESAARTVERWPELSLSLSPIAQDSFWEDLRRYERIRVASIKMARPNPGWTDVKNKLTKVAIASNAATISLETTAARGSSLAHDDGTVSFILSMEHEEHPTMIDAKISGLREGDARESTISYNRYVKHATVGVPLDDHGHVIGSEIESKLLDFVAGRLYQGD